MGQRRSGGTDSLPLVSGVAIPLPMSGERRQGSPQVSVIIATLNWSAALSCAIRSVLRQTLQDFEILVVGDACTDDSEAVVASFGDARIAWINLGENSGSQQGPNNAGLGLAKGEWIAYLGHDDIWAPRHLESALAAACDAGTQVAASGMIMYGPPGSGTTSIAGVFACGRCSEQDFVPPSALVHTRALIAKIGHWTDPRDLRLPTDCEFFQRARAANPVVSSNQITVFKFNAAARRNAYQTRSIAEQQWCLDGLDRGDRFIAEELAKVLASVRAGLSQWIEMPDAEKIHTGELFRANRIAKGVEPRFQAGDLRSLDQPQRFGLEHEPTGFEWHAVERHPEYGAFRWTGPCERSTIELPIRADRRLDFRLHVLDVIATQSARDIVVEAQQMPVATAIEQSPAGTWLVAGTLAPTAHNSFPSYVQLTVGGVKAARPAGLGINADMRRVGIAINWIELAPSG